MKQYENEWIDINEKAEKAGIEMPVKIEPALFEKLKPSPYLASLGVTLERRIENLLSMVNANLTIKDRQEHHTDQRYYLPFMMLKGPLVAEEFFPVIARITAGEEDRPSITLTEAGDTE
jgi:hypothetical protein